MSAVCVVKIEEMVARQGSNHSYAVLVDGLKQRNTRTVDHLRNLHPDLVVDIGELEITHPVHDGRLFIKVNRDVEINEDVEKANGINIWKGDR